MGLILKPPLAFNSERTWANHTVLPPIRVDHFCWGHTLPLLWAFCKKRICKKGNCSFLYCIWMGCFDCFCQFDLDSSIGRQHGLFDRYDWGEGIGVKRILTHNPISPHSDSLFDNSSSSQFGFVRFQWIRKNWYQDCLLMQAWVRHRLHAGGHGVPRFGIANGAQALF